ncbi:MAG: alpha-L-fucosidase [Lentisphaeria bacterium]|nr:alpha-L-fucosidase [Lentisphaeria bacterium]
MSPQPEISNPDPVKEWFSRRRMGLFLHFGLYTIEGWHEQDQMRRRIPREEYVKLITRFNPTAWDADAIINLAREVGMEYACLTSKHHDGFCLWDTKQTDFNVMNAPYGKDIIREFADACHRRSFPLGIYYSVVDWHQPNYPNQGRHHEIPPQAEDRPDWDQYMAFLKAQVTELCTNYGEVRHWFWDMNVPEVQDPSVNALIRSLQPNIVINNRGFDEGDFGTPERNYGHDLDKAGSGFSRNTEACNSVGAQSWGYRKDESYYATSYLIQAIDEMMSNGANYLLNVGPDATGKVPDTAVRILREIGSWYGKVRESFGDAVPASEIAARDNVLLTRRANTLYVHLKKPVESDALILPPIDVLPKKAVLLNTGEELACSTDMLPVHWQKEKRFLWIKGLPRHLLDSSETLVIRLDFDDCPKVNKKDANEFQG